MKVDLMRFLITCLVSLLTAGAAYAGAHDVSKGPFSDDVLKEADQTRGLELFTAQCGACHTLLNGGGNLAGPNLGSLFLRNVGTKEGFAYSDIMKNAGFTWTPEKLAEWLRDPDGFLPGNKMPTFDAIAEEDLKHILAYISVRTESASWAEAIPEQTGPKLSMAEYEAMLKSSRPDFWSHLFDSTSNFIVMAPEGEYKFVAYFNEDGSVTSNGGEIGGFWRVENMSSFCYALYGLPIYPYEWVECFPIAPNSVERYGEGLWISEPVPGLKVKGGFYNGRPYPGVDDSAPEWAKPVKSSGGGKGGGH